MDDLRFVLRGKNRIAVIKILKEGPKVATALREKTGIHKSHIKRVLEPLLERELIECLNPKDEMLKIYKLTKKGHDIVQKIFEYT